MSHSKQSYSQILKSSSIIGGAQGVNMLIGIVRVKFVAVLIGPIGIGIVGTYKATIQFIQTLCGLGLQSSAVRDVAQAFGSGDDEQAAKTIVALRRMCWLTGGVGPLGVALCSKQLSQITFGNADHAMEISLVGLTILFANLKGGQTALLQGVRRIGDLARLNILGVTVGSMVSVGLYYFYGLGGIVPAIVSLSAIELVASWWFARRVPIAEVQQSWKESFRQAGGMVRLGLAFMWSGFLVAGVAYLTRVLITQEIDLVAVGLFSAAYALSGMVVNFVLGAMGADYYPSLTAVNKDRAKMRDLVNQQTEIGILLAFPALLGTLAMAPWLIRIFYSGDFAQASDLLQWFAIGCVGRVISWPMGFVILAKGASRLFAVTETITNVVHIVLVWIGLKWFGLEGCAIAFATLYILYILFMLGVTRVLIDLRWSREVLTLVVGGVIVGGVVLLISRMLPLWSATLLGLLISIALAVYCLRELIKRIGSQHRLSRWFARATAFK